MSKRRRTPPGELLPLAADPRPRWERRGKPALGPATGKAALGFRSEQESAVGKVRQFQRQYTKGPE